MGIKQHNLQAPPGARRSRKRAGRGDGGSRGTYAGRGVKGQKSRSGSGPRTGMEGWQLPWIKGMPKKRGFTPPFPRTYALVNLKRLEERFQANDEVTPERLVQVGLLRDADLYVKVLGDGQVTKPLTVSAHRFSAGAREKLLAAGGTLQDLPDSRRRGKKRSA